MVTFVHVSHLVYADLGLVVLRVDTSGDPVPGDLITIARRMAPLGSIESVIPAAGYLSESNQIQLVNGSAVIVDSTVPVDTTVEYLAGVGNEEPEVVTGEIIVPSGMVWHLGDPLRPYLDLHLTLSRANPVECPISASGKIILGLSRDSLDMQGEVISLPGSRNPLVYTEPIASPTFEIRFATRSAGDRQAAEDLFSPGGVLLLRAPSVYQFTQRYLAVTSVSIDRISGNHRKPWRIFTVQARECSQPPGASYGWMGARWQDLCSGPYSYWDDVTVAGISWGSLGYGTVGGAIPSSIVTYDEVDTTYADYSTVTATGKTYEELVMGA